MSLRKKYEKFHNVILEENVEVHHIVPRHEGGTDDIDNLIALTKEEHAQFHLKRFQEHGNFKDLCAFHMIGYNFTEAHKVSSSVGGKIGGKIARQKKVGIFRSEEERKEWASMGGRASIQSPNNPWSYWASKEGRLKRASMGGIASGQFQNKDFQSSMGKKGGVKNKGFIWINDGKKSYKYTRKQQELLSLDLYMKENPHIRRGRMRKV